MWRDWKSWRTAWIYRRIERGEGRGIMALWFSASSLYQNFYENWLPDGAVRSFIEESKEASVEGRAN